MYNDRDRILVKASFGGCEKQCWFEAYEKAWSKSKNLVCTLLSAVEAGEAASTRRRRRRVAVRLMVQLLTPENRAVLHCPEQATGPAL